MNELKTWLAERFRRDFDELKQNKIRVIALAVCGVLGIAFILTDDGSDVEEIDLDSPPLTKDLPVQKLPAKVPAKTPESLDGVKIVLGANSEPLYVGDPFAVPPKPKPAPKVEPPPKIELPPIPSPQIQPSQPTAPKEKIVLTGTAISGTNKTAMFLRDKKTEFLTVGDEIGGRIISDITPDFVTFNDGTRLYLQKELN
ncbi:MAG: hypothetical protein IJ774_03405 [Selenomonadaceae bacterium]|nr:hypothetical protein [Selenomonadaceae bacterium]